MRANLIKIFALGAAMLTGINVVADEAEDGPKVNVAFDVRMDYLYEKPDHDDSKVDDESNSGFHGRYLNLMLNGQINKQWTYSWRQRMNKLGDYGNDVFAATDWVYLRYQPVKNWAFAAGKQVVMIGGYEYDAAPIDIFFASRFWNNIACYQFGASATYITDNNNNEVSFQVCNSPYQGMSSSCYAYNLYWAGHMGVFSTLWSLNLIEYTPGHYATFIALGNRLHVGDLDLQVDIMNRSAQHHKFFAHDYSIIAKAEYALCPWATIYAKGGYDEFKALPGTTEHVDNPFYGGGFHFYPMKHGSRDLRIHVLVDRYSDNDGVHYNQFSVGLKWRVDLYRSK